MNIEEFLREAAGKPGVTGMELPAAEFIADAFRPYVDEVHITPLASVVAANAGTAANMRASATNTASNFVLFMLRPSFPYAFSYLE